MFKCVEDVICPCFSSIMSIGMHQFTFLSYDPNWIPEFRYLILSINPIPTLSNQCASLCETTWHHFYISKTTSGLTSARFKKKKKSSK